MKTDKFFIIGIILGLVAVIAGFTTFFVIMSITPNYITIKDDADVTSTYEKLNDDNIDTLGKEVYYFEDLLDTKTDDSFSFTFDKLALKNPSYLDFMFSFEINLAKLDGTEINNKDLENTSYSYFVDSIESSKKQLEKGSVSMVDFSFSSTNKQNFKVQLHKAENADLTFKFEYQTFKLLLLGRK